MNALLDALPRPVRRYVLHFEAAIEDAVTALAASLPPNARVLDAGAGEGAYKKFFPKQRYTGVDLGIGDTAWNYAGLDAVADLESLPFPACAFDAIVNIVTLEHVRHPQHVVSELFRVSRPGGRLLLVVPHEWEVHQEPHDFFRFTRHGVALLAETAGFHVASCVPIGGYFRLLARRLLGGHQFFPTPLNLLWLLLVSPAALLLPALDRLDSRRQFTLGYIAILEVGAK